MRKMPLLPMLRDQVGLKAGFTYGFKIFFAVKCGLPKIYLVGFVDVNLLISCFRHFYVL